MALTFPGTASYAVLNEQSRPGEQTSPWLSKIAYAAAVAALKSGQSAITMFGRLPAAFERNPFHV